MHSKFLDKKIRYNTAKVIIPSFLSLCKYDWSFSVDKISFKQKYKNVFQNYKIQTQIYMFIYKYEYIYMCIHTCDGLSIFRKKVMLNQKK